MTRHIASTSPRIFPKMSGIYFSISPIQIKLTTANSSIPSNNLSNHVIASNLTFHRSESKSADDILLQEDSHSQRGYHRDGHKRRHGAPLNLRRAPKQ